MKLASFSSLYNAKNREIYQSIKNIIKYFPPYTPELNVDTVERRK